MANFEFTAPDGKSYSVQGPEGATPAQAFQILQQSLSGAAAPAEPAAPAAPDIGENRESTVAALRGIPIAGAYVDKGVAALNAAAQPLLETGLSHADTFGERMAENEKKVKAATNAYEASHPIGTTVGKVALGTAAMVPVMAAAPEAFGVTGATLAGRAAAGAVSGGALSGVDAAARGENVPNAIAVGSALGGAAPAVGKIVGKTVQALRDMRAPPAVEVQSGPAIKDAATEAYDAIRASGVTVKPESVQKLASDIRNDFHAEGFRDYLSPKTYGVLNELERGDAFTTPTAAAGEAAPQIAQDVEAIRAKYGDGAAAAYERQQAPAIEAPGPEAAPVVAPAAAPKASSLLEFLASKGGLGPDAELEALGAHGHTVNVEGIGRRKLVKQGGWPLDYAREAAEEAGYLQGDHNGTSTVNNLLDAIDAEMRGQKRYPAGSEGHVTKREAVAMSEREQAEFDRHMQGLSDDLTAAGHSELGPEIKARAVKLMDSERMAPDEAVEHALMQLEQEDAATAGRASSPAAPGFPGDRPMVPVAAPAAPATVAAPKAAASRVVSFSDLHGLRRALGKAAQSTDSVERAAATRAISRLDRYLENIPEGDVIGGDAVKAAAMLKEANGNYTIAKLAERLQGKVDAAELQAASANSGANLENALRQRVKDILKSERLRRGFTSRELIEMQKIVRGTASANVIRALGNILGGGGGIGTVISGGAGALAGGPVGAVLAPAAGFALKKVGGRMTESSLARLDEMIRARAPLNKSAAAVRAAREAAEQERLARAERLATGGVRLVAGGVPSNRR